MLIGTLPRTLTRPHHRFTFANSVLFRIQRINHLPKFQPYCEFVWKMSEESVLSQRTIEDENICYLAVYGTLRDDDDSGASWTKDFISDIDEAKTGETITQYGIELYWSKQLNYPFALLLSKPNNNIINSTPNLPIIIPSITVRVLHWRDPSVWSKKLIRADQIEGYNPKDETNSEYVRRKIQVKLIDSGETVWCWIYVALDPKPKENWEKIMHGCWLKRHLNTT